MCMYLTSDPNTLVYVHCVYTRVYLQVVRQLVEKKVTSCAWHCVIRMSHSSSCYTTIWHLTCLGDLNTFVSWYNMHPWSMNDFVAMFRTRTRSSGSRKVRSRGQDRASWRSPRATSLSSPSTTSRSPWSTTSSSDTSHRWVLDDDVKFGLRVSHRSVNDDVKYEPRVSWLDQLWHQVQATNVVTLTSNMSHGWVVLASLMVCCNITINFMLYM